MPAAHKLDLSAPGDRAVLRVACLRMHLQQQDHPPLHTHKPPSQGILAHDIGYVSVLTRDSDGTGTRPFTPKLNQAQESKLG